MMENNQNYTEEEWEIYKDLKPETIKLFQETRWPRYAYDYLSEINVGLLIEKKTLGVIDEFYLEVADIGEEAYQTYRRAQLVNEIDAIDDKLEDFPQDFYKIANTIQSQAREVAQGEIRNYLDEI